MYELSRVGGEDGDLLESLDLLEGLFQTRWLGRHGLALSPQDASDSLLRRRSPTCLSTTVKRYDYFVVDFTTLRP